jgi:hypothetical protein
MSGDVKVLGRLDEGERVKATFNGEEHEYIIVDVHTDGEGCKQVVFGRPNSGCHNEAKRRHA